MERKGIETDGSPPNCAVYQRVLNDKLVFDSNRPGFITSARSLLRGLLERDPELRLMPDEKRLRDHVYFVGVDWDLVATRHYGAQWRPALGDGTSGEVFYFDKTFTDLEPRISMTDSTAGDEAKPQTSPHDAEALFAECE